MDGSEADNIIKQVKGIYIEIINYAEKAELDSFLSYYDHSPGFISFSAEGRMSNYEAFKNACIEYYTSLKEQKVITISDTYHVLNNDLVLVRWLGNIIALFKNRDKAIMNNYAITSVFKKLDGGWKIIHDHESALPPEVIRKEESEGLDR